MRVLVAYSLPGCGVGYIEKEEEDHENKRKKGKGKSGLADKGCLLDVSALFKE